MSAFTADGDFVPRLPAHPLRADATADPSFGRLVANSGIAGMCETAKIGKNCPPNSNLLYPHSEASVHA